MGCVEGQRQAFGRAWKLGVLALATGCGTVARRSIAEKGPCSSRVPDSDSAIGAKPSSTAVITHTFPPAGRWVELATLSAFGRVRLWPIGSLHTVELERTLLFLITYWQYERWCCIWAGAGLQTVAREGRRRACGGNLSA